MNDEIFDDLAIEQTALKEFGVKLDIKQVILRGAPAGRTSLATIFLTTDGKLFLYITAQSGMLLDDVRKIVSRMGLEPDVYLPPRGDSNYFDDIAKSKFKTTFPGRSIVSDDDLRFYKQLAPYNPALIRLSAVKTAGIIKTYSPDSGSWHQTVNFSYRKIKTS